MFNNARLILTAIVVSSTLVACGDNDATSTESTTAPSSTASTTSMTKIETGMSEQAAADLLGEASFSQITSIDTLTITHTEWTNDKGTTSIQFHNGKAVYNQFVATPAAD